MPKEVSQKLFGDTIPIFCPRLIRLCAFGKFIRGRDSDAISVLLRRTRARVIFQVCTIRPYAGWFLIQEAKAAVVKTPLRHRAISLRKLRIVVENMNLNLSNMTMFYLEQTR